MSNAVFSFKMVNTQGDEVINHCGGSCVGVFSAYELYKDADFLQHEVVTLQITWTNKHKYPKRVIALANELCPFEDVSNGYVFITKHHIQGIPFDRVIASLRILRYMHINSYSDTPYVQYYGNISDWINLQAPTIGELKDFEFEFDEDRHDIVDVQREFEEDYNYFNDEVAKARIVSLTSGKKKVFNDPLYPPLGGPNGCIGYFKDYQIVGHFKMPENNWRNYMGTTRTVFFDALEKFCNSLPDDAAVSIDHVLMCHGKQAESTVTKLYGNHSVEHVLRHRWDEMIQADNK